MLPPPPPFALPSVLFDYPGLLTAPSNMMPCAFSLIYILVLASPVPRGPKPHAVQPLVR